MSKTIEIMELEHKFKKEDSEVDYKQIKDMTKIICTFLLCGIAIITVGFGATGIVQLVVMGIAIFIFMSTAILFRTFGI